MSISSDKRRQEELEAGRRRLQEKFGYKAPEEKQPEPPINPVSPVPPTEGVALNIPGVGNYEAGQRVGTHTIVSDAPIDPAVLLAAATVANTVEDAPKAFAEVVQAASQQIDQEKPFIGADPADATHTVEVVANPAEGKLEVVNAEPVAAKVYTRDELEAIAANGIDDLRAISKPMGINGKSKAEIIGEILAAQGTEVTQQVTEEKPVSDDDIDALLQD